MSLNVEEIKDCCFETTPGHTQELLLVYVFLNDYSWTGKQRLHTLLVEQTELNAKQFS